MAYKVIVLKPAQAYVDRMSGDDYARVQRAFKLLELDPIPPSAKPMTGSMKGYHRYRVGGYRIVYEIKREIRIINIVEIGPRGDIYKGH